MKEIMFHIRGNHFVFFGWSWSRLLIGGSWSGGMLCINILFLAIIFENVLSTEESILEIENASNPSAR